jgi:hypothetical protein
MRLRRPCFSISKKVSAGRKNGARPIAPYSGAASSWEKTLKTLSVYRIKPNPTGKDRNRSGSISAAQLGGEWVDLRNNGSYPLNTSGVSLYHLAYPASSGKAEYRLVVNLPDCTLKSGEVLRVHAGQRRDLSVLNAEDRTGADWHSFTGEDEYVWNNREGDTPAIYEHATRETIDSASYEAYPPEGAVLHRQGAKLVPIFVAAVTYR